MIKPATLRLRVRMRNQLTISPSDEQTKTKYLESKNKLLTLCSGISDETGVLRIVAVIAVHNLAALALL